MTLLMEKLDHLHEEIQDVQSADSNAEEEQQNNAVRQVQLNHVKCDSVI